MRGRVRTAVAMLAAVLLAGPAAGAAQTPGETESGFALLVHESSTDRLAGVAASTLPAGASAGLRLMPGVAAVHAAGAGAASAAARAVGLLAEGGGPEAAARAGAGESGPRRVALLTPGCGTAEAGSGSPVGPSEVRRGSDPGVCFLAVAFQPADSTALARMVSAFRTDRALPLGRRLLAALEAALRGEPDLRSARSAALWVSAGVPPEAPGDGALRLQAEDHPRPVGRLRDQLRLVTARELARSAGRRVAAGRYEEAAALADSALELDPGSTGAWMQRGRAQLFDERAGAAEESFRRMLELDPTMLRFLGDPTEPTVNRDLIPYAPRLLLRLDVYRRAYFRTVDFGPEPASPEGLPTGPAGRDTARAGTGG